jgi:hypothetical protein
LAFAIQRMEPTSPIYRGPNPMHIEVQICAHKGNKALHISRGYMHSPSNQTPKSQATGHSGYPHKAGRATGHSGYPHKTFQYVKLLDHQATGHSSYPHKSLPSNWTLQLSAQEPQAPNQRVYAKQDNGMHLHFHSIQKGRISTSSQVDWI